MNKTILSPHFVGKIKPEFLAFSLQTPVVFSSKIWLKTAGFFKWLGTKWAHTSKPPRANVQHSGHKGSAHASYLISCNQFESLFLAFSPRWIRFLQSKQTVRHESSNPQNVSVSTNDRGSLKSGEFRCIFSGRSHSCCSEGKKWRLSNVGNSDCLLQSLSSGADATLFKKTLTGWVSLRIGTEPCLFLNLSQLTSKRLHEVRVEKSREDFPEIK